MKTDLELFAKIRYNLSLPTPYHIKMTTTLPISTSSYTTNVNSTKFKFTDTAKLLGTKPAFTDTQPVDIAATLSQRGTRYGPFTGHAQITQELKQTMHNTKNWDRLTADQKESLEMIVHKIGRILNGDPNYDDSWVDIAGYAKLVGDRLTTGKET